MWILHKFRIYGIQLVLTDFRCESLFGSGESSDNLGIDYLICILIISNTDRLIYFTGNSIYFNDHLNPCHLNMIVIFFNIYFLVSDNLFLTKNVFCHLFPKTSLNVIFYVEYRYDDFFFDQQ
jgi:hypothetical protein